MKIMKQYLNKKSVSIFVICLFLMLLFFAFQISRRTKSVEREKYTELLMYRKGEKPTNYTDLMAFINQRLQKELGASLQIQYLGWGEYDKKMSVITSSETNYDIAFASNYRTNAQKGIYYDLTTLAPKYAKETYENLNPYYIQGNTINGRLFALPTNANVYGQKRMAFEQELVERYQFDLSKVKELHDLEPFLSIIKEKEPHLIPINFGPETRVGQMDYVYNDQIPLGIDPSNYSFKIINPYQESEQMINDLTTMHRYYQKGYLNPNSAILENDIAVTEKGWFVRFPTQGPFDYGDMALSKKAGRPILSIPWSKPIIDNMQIFVSNFVISSGSKHSEKALEVLNLINTDKELLTTMVYGLENQGWEKKENNRIRILPSYHPSRAIGGAWSVGDNQTIYLDEEVTLEQIQTREESIIEAEVSPLLGFSFDATAVTREMLAVSNIMNQYLAPLHSGTISPEKTLPILNEKLEEAGLSIVQKEMQKQFDFFLSQEKGAFSE